MQDKELNKLIFLSNKVALTLLQKTMIQQPEVTMEAAHMSCS
jgi:hypothetical protein